ncbi:hypothetical protein MBANPS3_007710 [Mucor bainieri]
MAQPNEASSFDNIQIETEISMEDIRNAVQAGVEIAMSEALDKTTGIKQKTNQIGSQLTKMESQVMKMESQVMKMLELSKLLYKQVKSLEACVTNQLSTNAKAKDRQTLCFASQPPSPTPSSSTLDPLESEASVIDDFDTSPDEEKCSLPYNLLETSPKELAEFLGVSLDSTDNEVIHDDSPNASLEVIGGSSS